MLKECQGSKLKYQKISKQFHTNLSKKALEINCEKDLENKVCFYKVSSVVYENNSFLRMEQ